MWQRALAIFGPGSGVEYAASLRVVTHHIHSVAVQRFTEYWYLGSHRPYCSVELLSGSSCILYRHIFNLSHCMPCTIPCYRRSGLSPKTPMLMQAHHKSTLCKSVFCNCTHIQHKIIVKSEFSCVATVLGTEGNHHVC